MPFTDVFRTIAREAFDQKQPRIWMQSLGLNIQQVLGKSKFQNLAEFSCELSTVKFYGYLTKTILSGSVSKVNKECTYFYLNFRPIDLPKKIKGLLQQLYQQYNPSGQVFIIINMLVADGCFDINVSPDKREVFLKEEAQVIKDLSVKLVEWFEEMQRVKAFEEPRQSSIMFEKKRPEPESSLNVVEPIKQSYEPKLVQVQSKPHLERTSNSSFFSSILEITPNKSINLSEP